MRVMFESSKKSKRLPGWWSCLKAQSLNKSQTRENDPLHHFCPKLSGKAEERKETRWRQCTVQRTCKRLAGTILTPISPQLYQLLLYFLYIVTNRIIFIKKDIQNKINRTATESWIFFPKNEFHVKMLWAHYWNI